MKYLIILVFVNFTMKGCTQKSEGKLDPGIEINELNEILLLEKTTLEAEDDRTYFRMKVLSNLLEKISQIDSFKSIELVEGDFCVISNAFLIDWDTGFNTTLHSQDNFIILSISPTGKCDDDDVLDIAVVDYNRIETAKMECDKMYSFFKKGGLRGPFSGHMTCYQEDGVLVMIEFLYGPNKDLFALFETVSNYSIK